MIYLQNKTKFGAVGFIHGKYAESKFYLQFSFESAKANLGS